jgi:hypothetical protein
MDREQSLGGQALGGPTDGGQREQSARAAKEISTVGHGFHLGPAGPAWSIGRSFDGGKCTSSATAFSGIKIGLIAKAWINERMPKRDPWVEATIREISARSAYDVSAPVA